MFKLLVVACLWAPAIGDDNADMVQMQLGSESKTFNDYYYYDDSDGQKWLANMSFSVAGLDYAKIMASGPLHFGVLWNIKSEIASGFGVPFENVSIFLSDAGNLNVAAVVVGPWMTKLDPTPDDIDTHLMDRIRAIPDIDSAKSEGFAGDLRLSVSTRRHDDGLWTTTTTTTSDGRRRRSPATHAPSAAPQLCAAPYTGSSVTPGGQNTAEGVAVTFSCSDSSMPEKHPKTGQVQCIKDGYSAGIAGWGPYSSGSNIGAKRLINWGCGPTNSCWELPFVTGVVAGYGGADGSVANANEKASGGAGNFNQVPNTEGSTVPPFPPVPAGGKWCGDDTAAGGDKKSKCCMAGTLCGGGGAATQNDDAANYCKTEIGGTPTNEDGTGVTCSADTGEYTSHGGGTGATASAFKCLQR